MSAAMSYGAEARETVTGGTGVSGGAGERMRLVRPRALVITAAPPEREGAEARRRAWRLFELVQQTHEIHLIAQTDAPVHYDHWRELSQLTRQVMLAPRRGPFVGSRVVSHTVDTWAASHSFDAVMGSDVTLWKALRGVPARVRFCESRHDLGLLAEVLAAPMVIPSQRATASPLRRAA